MKEYTVYFEIFGKKMKTTIHALSEERAKERVKDKIIFHKVQLNQKEKIDALKKMFKDAWDARSSNPFKDL